MSILLILKLTVLHGNAEVAHVIVVIVVVVIYVANLCYCFYCYLLLIPMSTTLTTDAACCPIMNVVVITPSITAYVA
jgi:hypothetical protein